MAISTTYNLSYLESRQIATPFKHKDEINKTYNKLKPLFPVEKGLKEGKIPTPWAFLCLCGNFCVQSLSQVKRGGNKSCGCAKRVKGTNQGLLQTIKYLLEEDCNVEMTKEGSHYKARDWGFRCTICDKSSTKLNAWEVLRSGKKFCKCSGKNTCNTREEAIEDLKDRLKGGIWKLVNFPEIFTTKGSCRVDIKCKECDNTHKNVLYQNAYRKGCPYCANKATSERLSKDTSWFVERSSEIHDFKYDYSKVLYKKAREKVEIICHEHGKPFHFWQSPDNHKNKGKGCPECKRLRLKYVAFGLSRVEEKKDHYKTLPSGVYLSTVGDSYKIGITCNLHKRCKEIEKDSKQEVNNLVYKEMNMYEAFMLEHSLHREYEDYRKYSKEYWAGHSECFTFPNTQVEEIIKTIESYKTKE